MPLVFGGAGSPFRKPSAKARSTGKKRRSGVFSFGYFSLDKQRKVSRLPVREPALNKLRGSESLLMETGNPAWAQKPCSPDSLHHSLL
jgi:hypothetical protein